MCNCRKQRIYLHYYVENGQLTYTWYKIHTCMETRSWKSGFCFKWFKYQRSISFYSLEHRIIKNSKLIQKKVIWMKKIFLWMFRLFSIKVEVFDQIFLFPDFISTKGEGKNYRKIKNLQCSRFFISIEHNFLTCLQRKKIHLK